MNIVKHKGAYYLSHSFRKNGKVTHRGKYLGKSIPKNIDDIKIQFLRKCLEEDVLIKLNRIKQNFNKEWKK